MFKNIFLIVIFSLASITGYGQSKPKLPDSVKLTVNDNNAYYQKTVKVDSNITENKIYIRALEFMAAKNFQQNYGYDEEGKLICTTSQDLNNNDVSANDDSDPVDPYSVQFAIIVDMKNGRYRYTIDNVVFYLPTETGNRRLTLHEMYEKATNSESRHVARDAKKLIASFERYITTLTGELYQAVEQKSVTGGSKF